MLVNTELNDANLISAINAKVITVAAYPMNVCKFNNGELNQLDQVIYKETRLRVACYMSKSTIQWIKAAWRREQRKEENAIIAECLTIMEEVGVRIRFEGGNIRLDDELVEAEWKTTWKKVKSTLKKGVECSRVESYKTEEWQSKVFRDQEQECHPWLTQKLHPRKTSAIMDMLEQMVEKRSWKVARGLMEDGRCRVCFEHIETMEHLVGGCKVLAKGEYLSRHKRALMILAIARAKEHDLVGQDVVWYKERWEGGTVLENGKAKLIGDIEFHLRKITTARRPDLILEDK